MSQYKWWFVELSLLMNSPTGVFSSNVRGISYGLLRMNVIGRNNTDSRLLSRVWFAPRIQFARRLCTFSHPDVGVVPELSLHSYVNQVALKCQCFTSQTIRFSSSFSLFTVVFYDVFHESRSLDSLFAHCCCLQTWIVMICLLFWDLTKIRWRSGENWL